LNNPRNDAALVAKSLKNVGFELVDGGPQLDLDKPAFDHVVQDFGNALQGATTALFYFAGHGIEINGSNYLVPTSPLGCLSAKRLRHLKRSDSATNYYKRLHYSTVYEAAAPFSQPTQFHIPD
jgi:hypothetical protein